MPDLLPRRAKPPADSEPGDELGPWPRERLMRMDERFVSAVERAIERGDERRPQSDEAGANSSRALGLTVPPGLLVAADEVIE